MLDSSKYFVCGLEGLAFVKTCAEGTTWENTLKTCMTVAAPKSAPMSIYDGTPRTVSRPPMMPMPQTAYNYEASQPPMMPIPQATTTTTTTTTTTPTTTTAFMQYGSVTQAPFMSSSQTRPQFRPMMPAPSVTQAPFMSSSQTRPQMRPVNPQPSLQKY